VGQGVSRSGGGGGDTLAGGTGTGTISGLLFNSPRRPLAVALPAAVASAEVIARISPPTLVSRSPLVGGARTARMHKNTNTPDDIIRRRPGG
jgi:hypothetical protein